MRSESGHLCHGVSKRDKVGLKEHFALGSSDMVWMAFVFKAVSSVEILPCGLCSFLCAYYTSIWGENI